MPAGGWASDIHRDGKANQYVVLVGSVIFQISIMIQFSFTKTIRPVGAVNPHRVNCELLVRVRVRHSKISLARSPSSGGCSAGGGRPAGNPSYQT